MLLKKDNYTEFALFLDSDIFTIKSKGLLFKSLKMLVKILLKELFNNITQEVYHNAEFPEGWDE